MKTLFYSPGEPAGIGPDLFLSLLDEDFFRFIKAKVIFLGSKDLFSSRASELGYKFNINSSSNLKDLNENIGLLEVTNCHDTSSGALNSNNADYIIDNLDYGINRCLENKDFGLVTAVSYTHLTLPTSSRV